jgi:hypothetical protein
MNHCVDMSFSYLLEHFLGFGDIGAAPKEHQSTRQQHLIHCIPWEDVVERPPSHVLELVTCLTKCPAHLSSARLRVCAKVGVLWMQTAHSNSSSAARLACE